MMTERLRLGDTVNWKPWNKEARIVEMNSRREKARIVLCNSSFQKWVPWKELQLLSPPNNTCHSNRENPEIQFGQKAFRPSLDLHGKTVEEGLAEVDAFLNQAYIRNIKRVEIIHGEGTGKLRNAVRDFLKANDLVDSYDYAHPNLGGLGVTIIYLNIIGDQM